MGKDIERFAHLQQLRDRALPAGRRTPEALDPIRETYRGFLGKQIPAWLEQAMEHDPERPDGSRVRVQTRTFTVVTEKGFMVGAISREMGAGPVWHPDELLCAA